MDNINVTKVLNKVANKVVQNTEANLVIVCYNPVTEAMTVRPEWEADLGFENILETMAGLSIEFADNCGAGEVISVYATRLGEF